MKRILNIFIVTLALFGALFTFAGSAKAASWDPGRIIDDGKFTNKNSMSVGDIQNFLNSKVPTCDTWHAPGPSSQGATPPWICLKNYNEGGKSAAQIIWEQAQNYNINPQVLLVTLQKENGLITDTWPYPWQYRTAMGFGCPDGAPCDSQWFGFTNQVTQAARHFRNFYDQNPNWYIPYRPGVSYIRWSPNGACGGSNVNIVNRATAALYSYTPYQPNQAALNNLYGTGDGCSAYGNRNFWRDFNNWFGSTIDDPYRWEYITQSASGSFVAGQKGTWTLSARNVGTSTWTNSGANPVRLGTNNPRDRGSAFCATGWVVGCHRAANLNEASVPPGSVGTFTFPVQAPGNGGTYSEYFNLVAEGITWMNDPGLYYQPSVAAGNFSSSLVSNNFPASIAPGATASVSIVLRNNGNTHWYNDGKYSINLGTYNPMDRTSVFATNTWPGSSRPARMVEAVVAPGQNATFNFAIKAPATPGSYTENFSLLAEGLRWFNQPITSNVTVTGTPPPPPPPPPSPGSNFTGTMSINQALNTNQMLISPDGRYKLIMQGDGNLVLYSPNRPIWWTSTNGKPVNLFAVQGDGNLVLYDAQFRPYWFTNTQGRGGTMLALQDDGNLVLYDAQFRPIWNTRTNGRI